MIDRILKRIYIGLEYEKKRPPDEKGFLNYIKRRFSSKESYHCKIIIASLNYCNLSCPSCGATGAPGMIPEQTQVKHVENLLERLKDWNPNSPVLVYGGEPTLLSDEYLTSISECIRSHGRQVVMMSNGYRIVNLNLFDKIILDDHGINKNDIEKYVEHIEQSGWKGEYKINHSHYHIDIDHIRSSGNISHGLRCNRWMENITLWKDVVYPCCVLLSIERWDGDTMLFDQLRKSGWSTNNSLLAEYIENWRGTLPAIVYKKCLLGCWRDADEYVWNKISP